MSRQQPPPGTPCLVGEHLTRRFGGLTAVDDVSLSLPATGLFGLCGPNGAGKSTLFNLLAGADRADTGRVVLNGVDVTADGATVRARAGVTRTWQGVRLLEDRSVLDNVAIGYPGEVGRSMFAALFRGSLRTARERARAVLDELDLGGLVGRQVGALTLEGQRMVELARAVVTDPVVILADEPASGLSRGQRLALADFLVELAETRAMVVVEHDIDLLERISTRLYAMVDGRLAYEGDVPGFLSSAVRSSLRGLAADTDQLARTRDET
ncbi:MAG TPA: ATP-binding cassette domain-containing protein [Pseudonocardiaceae bacterium]|nr:ATP-binding cassette domain-containing protein [Pseudonocardiaceae bacterium]